MEITDGVPDAARKLYEQVGALYGALEAHDPAPGADGADVQELTDFLATVHEVARTARTPIGEALATAIRRYERDRSGA